MRTTGLETAKKLNWFRGDVNRTESALRVRGGDGIRFDRLRKGLELSEKDRPAHAYRDTGRPSLSLSLNLP